jgi:hypothetical protein
MSLLDAHLVVDVPPPALVAAGSGRSTPIVIKMNRGRKALGELASFNNSTSSGGAAARRGSGGNGLDSSSNSNHDWKIISESVKTWMKSNPLGLGVPKDGAIESIRASLERGEKFEQARGKCWEHILIELVSVQDSRSISSSFFFAFGITSQVAEKIFSSFFSRVKVDYLIFDFEFMIAYCLHRHCRYEI